MLPKQILVFEDVVFRTDLDRSFRDRQDIAPKTARSGWEIVVSTSFVKPDLVVLDHWLPDMLGDEVIDQMRRQPTLKEVPVLLLAPAIGPAAMSRLKRLGPIILYREKPDKNVLLKKIIQLLALPLRRQPRITMKIPVKIFSGQFETAGFTKTLSSIGTTIVSKQRPEPGSHLRIDFLADEQGSFVEVSTKAVVRNVTRKKNDYFIGAEFVDTVIEFEQFLSLRVAKGQRIAYMMDAIERLPTLPSVTAVVLEEMLQGRANPKRMVSLIRSEPALATYLLKTANATAYRLSSPVLTVEKALEQLELNTVRSSMLGFSLFRDLQSASHLYGNVRDIWMHSLACGLYCELLAERFGLDAEEAYTLGLLHDVGKIVLLSEYLNDQIDWSVYQLGSSWSKNQDLELFGIGHAEVGAAVLAKWQIPEALHKIVGLHHSEKKDHSGLSDSQSRSLEMLQIANQLTRSDTEHAEKLLTMHQINVFQQKVENSIKKTEDAFGHRDESTLCTEAVELANQQLSQELHSAQERNALLTRAYERTRLNLISLVQGEKYHALGRILQGVSHEMNNPLGFVLSNLNTLIEYATSIQAFLHGGADSPSRLEMEEIINDLPTLVSDTHEGVLRVSSVVQALRHFHLEGKSRLALTNLRKCVQEAVALVKPSKPEGVIIEVGPGQVEDAYVDHGGMVRVFMEIMLNAFAAMPMGGRLGIDFQQDLDYAIVWLRDNGEGISEENIKHVFEPFFTTRSVGDGMGLGLSVAYGIVSKHQGKLIISSNAGQGTVVEVRIPSNSKN